MTKEEYERFLTEPVRPIRADDLPGPDRTLLTGWNFDRQDFVVTLEDGMIVRQIGYKVEESEEWPAAELNPGKRARPHRTDFGFARLMRDRGEIITYTQFED